MTVMYQAAPFQATGADCKKTQSGPHRHQGLEVRPHLVRGTGGDACQVHFAVKMLPRLPLTVDRLLASMPTAPVNSYWTLKAGVSKRELARVPRIARLCCDYRSAITAWNCTATASCPGPAGNRWSSIVGFGVRIP